MLGLPGGDRHLARQLRLAVASQHQTRGDQDLSLAGWGGCSVLDTPGVVADQAAPEFVEPVPCGLRQPGDDFYDRFWV